MVQASRRQASVARMREFLLVPAILLVSLQPLMANEDDKEIKLPVETKPFVVVIQDEDGNPVPGATVRANGMRVEESPGSYYRWPTNNVGQAPEVITDEQGRASFDYPPKFGQHPDWLHTVKVCYYVEHPEFIKEHVETAPDDSPWTETVVPGCELVVSGKTPGREIITDLGVMIANNEPKFAPGDGPGVIRSRAIPHGLRQVMLIGPDLKGGKHLFSQVRQFPFAKSKRVTLRGITLRPGLEVVGQLSDEVPRPVKHGIVISYSLPMPQDQTNAKTNASLGWSDVTEIQADGSFHFPSLPSTGKLQLIAVCDGWVIKREANTSIFTSGMIYDLDVTENRWDNLVIPMEPTTSVKVVVTDQAGKPIKDAKVSAWPNQKLEMSGSQILGTVFPSVNSLNKNRSRKRHPLSKSHERYVSKTNDQGIAILRDLPIVQQPIAVSHDDYQVPKIDETWNLRSISLELDSSEQKTVNVTLEPRPKPSKE